MTFTFLETLLTDRDFVRFKTGDTIQAEAMMSDELIGGLVTLEGSREGAAVAGARYILLMMAKPDFVADWLETKSAPALQARMKLLNDLIAELDPSAESISVDAVSTYRADSGQTSEPVWQSDGRP